MNMSVAFLSVGRVFVMDFLHSRSDAALSAGISILRYEKRRKE